MPVHFAGQAAEMDEILKIAKEHNLHVIEDSAEAIGAEYHGKKAGSFSAACFSFFPTKNMTTGEGGMFTSNDEELAERVKTLASHGISNGAYKRKQEKRPWLRAATEAGYNFRMSNILAAVGVEQLKKIDKMNDSRREHAKYLTKNLMGLDIDLPTEYDHCKHVYQMYTVKVKKNRDDFVLKLREKGVGASVHFDPPVHRQPYYVNHYPCRFGDLPVTEKLSKSIVTLPLYPTMNKSDLDLVIASVKESL